MPRGAKRHHHYEHGVRQGALGDDKIVAVLVDRLVYHGRILDGGIINPHQAARSA